MIEALISLYQATFDEKYLTQARLFADYAIENFYDASSGLFFFTSKLEDELIARKTEI